MRKCCFIPIGLILAIIISAGHYDIYIPEVRELPEPYTISNPSYTFIEAGIASNNSSVFYSDIIRSDFCIKSFIHSVNDRTVSSLILRSSKSITDNITAGIGTHALYRNNEGIRYSSIPLSPFARLHFNNFDITYSPIVSFYSDNKLHNDIFQRFSMTFSPNEYSVKLYSSRIAEHGGIAVGYNDLQAGLEFYSNLMYPAVSYRGGNEDYSLTVRSGFRHSRPLDYYTGLFSPLMDSADHYRESFAYSLNTILQVHSFSLDIMSCLADEPDNYRDIHYSDIHYKVSAGYFMRIDRTLLEASVSAVKTDSGNWNYGDIHLRHDRNSISGGIVHEIQYVHKAITNILSAYIVFHAPIALKTGVRNILSRDDYVNYYYNSERTFFINFEYSSGQFIK
ncbi:MAG: hypothetical protein SVK54_07105 [candidate division WOR-3 bacterium]|nr:hypothetical protein [candidate division WOR-3 bacterium]